MADKASRGLVVYGDGLARHLIPNGSSSSSYNYNCNYNYNYSASHLHSFASKAYCGFLSLPLSPPSETEENRVVREFLQLLDACEGNSGVRQDFNAENCEMATLSERFMGMKLAVITNNAVIKSIGSKLGFTVYQLSDLISGPTDDSSYLTLTHKLLSLLGFQEGKVLETSPFDMVFVHVNGNENNGDENIQFIDNLVGEIMHLSDQGSEISSRLHMSVLMSYGSVSEDDISTFSVMENNGGNNSVLPMLFPQQSYTMKGNNVRPNVRHYCPMLIAQLEDGVTRKDLAETFNFEDFKKQGCMLTIPADRFIHEVAFKIWKAPKYGA